MSYTGPYQAYLGIDEGAMNVMIEAFRIARPWMFSYATSALGGYDPPVKATLMDPIAVPGTESKFHYRIDFTTILIDCFPETPGSGLPAELEPFENNEFAIRADLTLTIIPPGAKKGEFLKVTLRLWLVGSPTAEPVGWSKKRLGLDCRGVEIVDITPTPLENIIEIFIRIVLEEAVLPKITFVFDKISTDFFSLELAEGPHIDDNRLNVKGEVL